MDKPLIYYRDLILTLVTKEFRVRYKSTFLGYVWSVLQPLAFAVVFYVVFRIVLRIRMNNFALFLIAGLFPWQWFSNSVSAANGFFVGNSSLIKKVRFPRAFLVVAGVLNDLIHFVISIPVIVIFMLWHHRYPSLSWLWLIPLMVLIQFAFTYGLALLVATCNLFFRDLERLMMIFLLMWFYLTPVFYPVDMVPARYRAASLYANPMASVIACWRSVFLGQPAYYLLRASDLRDPALFASRLRNTQDPAVAHLRKFMSPGALRLLDSAAADEQALKAALKDLEVNFPAFSIYDEQVFRDIPLTSEVRTLMAEEPIGWDLAYLNRRLTEAAFPEDIIPVTVFPTAACLACLAWAALACAAGTRVYKAMEWRFAESV